MSGWTPWRTAAVPPLPPKPGPPPDRQDLAARLDTERKKNLALGQRVRVLEDQARAGAAMLAAAQTSCAKSCAHARVAAELRVQLAAMQQRLTELQDTNQRFESRGFARRGGAS